MRASDFLSPLIDMHNSRVGVVRHAERVPGSSNAAQECMTLILGSGSDSVSIQRATQAPALRRNVRHRSSCRTSKHAGGTVCGSTTVRKGGREGRECACALQAHLNQALATHNPNYKALYVSWNDNQRQQGSCFGSNITDARLKGKASGLVKALFKRPHSRRPLSRSVHPCSPAGWRGLSGALLAAKAIMKP